MDNGVSGRLTPACLKLARAVAHELATATADEIPQLPMPRADDLSDAGYYALWTCCKELLDHGDPINEANLRGVADRELRNPAMRAHVTDELLIAFLGVVREPDKPPEMRWCRPLGPLSWVPPDESKLWLIQDLLLRAEPQMLAGPPKSGKTWLGLLLAIAAATGTGVLSWLNPAGTPIRVLVISLEDSESDARTRVSQLLLGLYPSAIERQAAERLIGANLAISTLGVRLPDSVSLSACIEECRAWKPELIVIDNLTRVMDGDPNSAKDAAAVTNVWADLSRELHAAILLLHHTSKPAPHETRDRFDRIRGSGDLLAVARNALLLERIGESDVLDLGIRGNRQLKRDRAAIELVHQPSQHLDGWLASAYADRGDPETLRELEAERKTTNGRKRKNEARKLEQQQEWNERVTTIKAWIAASGPIMSTAALGAILDLSKAQAARIIQRLLAAEVLVRDVRTGAYNLKDDSEAP